MKRSTRKFFEQTSATLLDHEDRLVRLEQKDAGKDRAIASLEMRVRDAEIRERSAKGEKGTTLAQEYDLSPGRISQIINN